MISGAVVLIASFLPFLSIPSGEAGLSGWDWNAWSNALNLFPITTLLVLYAVAAAGQLALARYANVNLPTRIASFTWSDLRLLIGTLATVTMLGYFFRGFEGNLDRGIGLYLMTLGAIGLLVGAVMAHREDSSAPAPRSQDNDPPSQGDIAIMASAGLLVLGSFLTVFTVAGESSNAWADGLAPLYLVPMLLGVAMAILIGVAKFTSRSMPTEILGLDLSTIHRGFGFHAALMMLGFWFGEILFTARGESLADVSRGAGFWLMLLGGLGLAAGAILRERGPLGASTTPDQGAGPAS